MGPIIFLILFNVVQFALRFGLMHWSYKVGLEGVKTVTKYAKEFTRSATILGVIVVGALIASYVGVPITAEIPNGESVIVVQEILDGIMPCLLPLGLTFGLYGLVKRGASPLVNIAILVVLGLLGALIGLF